MTNDTDMLVAFPRTAANVVARFVPDADRTGPRTFVASFATWEQAAEEMDEVAEELTDASPELLDALDDAARCMRDALTAYENDED